MANLEKACSLFGDSEREIGFRDFQLTERIYPPNLKTPDHTHENALFTFVLGGRYTEVFGTQKRECDRASALFHPGGDIHAEHFHDAGGRLFIVEMKKRWTARIKRGFDFPVETVQSRSGNLAALGARAYAEFERSDSSSPLVIEGLMLEIIGEAARLQGLRAVQKGPSWLEEVENILSLQFAEPLQLRDIAVQVKVHPVHLAQAYKKFRNLTIGARIREIRLENARELLKFTTIPVAQVAAQSGFSDQSHLSRLFRKRYGLPPRAYRESI